LHCGHFGGGHLRVQMGQPAAGEPAERCACVRGVGK
jgi:hypothetical protein